MRIPACAFVLLPALVLGPACGDDGGASGSDAAPQRPVELGTDARPATLRPPPTLTEGKRYPLVLVLHGYGATGLVQSAYFGAANLPAQDAAFVIAPDGTTDSSGKQFWNADPACCDFDGTGVDDVGYLSGIIDTILASDWPIDPAQVFVIGHSNGGFMAYRMACERADVIAAIAPLAGLASSQPASCTPARPVAVLHLHGSADEVVPFSGAGPSTDQWAQRNGCGTTRTAGADRDLEKNLTGAETHTATVDGCPADGQVEQWTIDGGGHVPVFGPTFTQTWVDWFAAHAR